MGRFGAAATPPFTSPHLRTRLTVPTAFCHGPAGQQTELLPHWVQRRERMVMKVRLSQPVVFLPLPTRPGVTVASLSLRAKSPFPSRPCFPSQLAENLKAVLSLAAIMRAAARTHLPDDPPAGSSRPLFGFPSLPGWGDQRPWHGAVQDLLGTDLSQTSGTGPSGQRVWGTLRGQALRAASILEESEGLYCILGRLSWPKCLPSLLGAS